MIEFELNRLKLYKKSTLISIVPMERIKELYKGSVHSSKTNVDCYVVDEAVKTENGYEFQEKYALVQEFAGEVVRTSNQPGKYLKIVERSMVFATVENNDLESMEAIKARGPRITVRVLDKEQTNEFYDGGVSTYNERELEVKYGEILNIGEDCINEHEVGDIVVFETWAGNKTHLDDVVVIPEDTCLYDVAKQ